MNATSEEARPTPTPPLQRDIRSPGSWHYLINYIMLGAASLILVIEVMESGIWRKLWMPIVLICFAIANLVRMQAAERRLR